MVRVVLERSEDSDSLSARITCLGHRQGVGERIKQFRNFCIAVWCDEVEDLYEVKSSVTSLCNMLMDRVVKLKSLEIFLDCRKRPKDGSIRSSCYKDAPEYDEGIYNRNIFREEWEEHHPDGISRVLQPFAMLRNVGHIAFHKVPDNYANLLKEQMQSNLPNHLPPMLKRLLRILPHFYSRNRAELKRAVEENDYKGFDKAREESLTRLHEDLDGVYNQWITMFGSIHQESARRLPLSRTRQIRHSALATS